MGKVIKKAPVIGLVRYSQKVQFKERDVFEAEYFEYRFDVFKNVTLKSFQQQTNKNFVLLLLHSENMPDQYKDRFFELEQKNPFLHNVFVKDTRESIKKALKNSVEYVSFEKDVAITFRIDNDDAVQYDFIQKLNNFLKNEFHGFAISMPSLCVVKHISSTSYMVEERYYPLTSIGLAYVTRRSEYKTVMEIGDHSTIFKTLPRVLLEESGGGGLMTINGENVANTINGGVVVNNSRIEILNKEDLNKYLLERKIKNLDLDCLRTTNKWSTFSLKKILKLFVPPLFTLILQKVKKQH